jgi:alkanesulfonate monooxygenase SsuD/methylene tetrahydromethanopterin reductase-like flavin-dependent oxidoreductase (luciferase family)
MSLSIGVMLSVLRATRPEDLRSNARHAEDVGLDALFVGDHLVAAVPVLDSTLTLATAAAVTDRIGIGFGVMLPALRGPAWAAKQIATLQELSGNRVILGVGSGGDVHGTAGWEAAGVTYAERGWRTDAALAALPRLIAGEPTRLETGATITLAPGALVPPIWIGGRSAVALRRAAEHGTAWFPSMVLPEDIARGARRLSELADERGRPTPAVAVGGSALLGADAPNALLDGFAAGVRDYGVPPDRASQLAFTGEPAQAAERFAEYAQAGASHLVLGVIGDGWPRQCELIAAARALLDHAP